VVRRSRGPRHQYDPENIVLRVLADDRLARIVEIIFSMNRLVHASDIARELGISIGHAYNLLRKLEKWGVLKGVRDPLNGRLGFRPASSRTAEIVAEEIRKRRVKEVEEAVTEVVERYAEE